MQIRTLLAPAAAAGAVALALSPPAARIAFHPEEGRALTKSFTSTLSMDMDELSLVFDGQDFGGMMGDVTFHLATEGKYVVTDEYAAMGEGRPEKLVRTFDELTQSQEVDFAMANGGSDSQSTEAESELEGLTVVFTWDGDSSEYVVSFGDGSGDEDLLEGLEEDMDLRGLLPPDEVSEGDSWDIPGKALAGLAMPGGNLKLIPDNVDEADLAELEDLFADIQEEFGGMLEDALDSGSTGTFRGMRDVDGTEVAVIDLDLDVSVSMDLTDMIYDVLDEVLSQGGVPDDLELDLSSAQLDMSFTGAGELLWDAAAGHARALDVTGEVEISMDITVDVTAQGETHSIEAFFAMIGDLRNTVAVE